MTESVKGGGWPQKFDGKDFWELTLSHTLMEACLG